MFVAASTTAQLTQSFADTGAILVMAISAIVAGAIALMGLGFSLRHLKKWVTGRKF